MKKLIVLSLTSLLLTGCRGTMSEFDAKGFSLAPAGEVTAMIPCDANNCGKLPN